VNIVTTIYQKEGRESTVPSAWSARSRWDAWDIYITNHRGYLGGEEAVLTGGVYSEAAEPITQSRWQNEKETN